MAMQEHIAPLQLANKGLLQLARFFRRQQTTQINIVVTLDADALGDQ